jgi:hypothetical protein
MTLIGSSSHTYQTFPSLQKPENNVLLLLTWSMVVSGHQLKVLSEWASSDDSSQLYKQLLSDFQGPQSPEQLALTMAALMSYRRLLLDLSDDSDRPIKGSYLADLDALLDGHSLGNSGIVGERMLFSLVRVFRSFVNQFVDLAMFLETVLDREPPLLHVFDGFCDQYLSRRIGGHTHETAMVELSHLKMPELRGDGDSDWVTVTLSEALPVQDHSQRPCSNYTLPATLTGNQHPPNNSTPERSILEHVPPKSDQIPLSSLCEIVTTLRPDGERSRKFFIHHPEIDRRVYELLQNKDKTELWDAAHALRDLRRQCLASSTPPLQYVDLVLEEVDGAIRSEIKDFAQCRLMDKDGQNTITSQRRNSRIFYSLIMLSYGAEATLSRNGQSHSAYLEDVLLGPCDSVTLVFNRVGKDDSYHHQFPVSDLPRLGNYGIELDLGPFRKFLSDQESSKTTTYGCTFSKCFDQFEKESHWRKHETLEHFQPECWQCALCAPGIKTSLFYKPAVFKEHLRSYHTADVEEIALQIERQRIGRGCRSRFWCGFCRTIVVLQKKGSEGSQERFDHIGGHFLDGEKIEDWREIDGSGVKGKERRGIDGSESAGYHISAASPTARSGCDTALGCE